MKWISFLPRERERAREGRKVLSLVQYKRRRIQKRNTKTFASTKAKVEIQECGGELPFLFQAVVSHFECMFWSFAPGIN